MKKEYRILPKNKWSEKDKKMLTKLNKLKLTPSDAYVISWALFHDWNHIKEYLEEIQCKKCWERKHCSRPGEYETEKRRLELRKKEMEKIVMFFSPYHNRLGEDYNYTCK